MLPKWNQNPNVENFLSIFSKCNGFFIFLFFRKWEYCGRKFHLKFWFFAFSSHKRKKTDPGVLIIRRLLLVVFSEWSACKKSKPGGEEGCLAFWRFDNRPWTTPLVWRLQPFLYNFAKKRKQNRKWSDFQGFPSPEMKTNWEKIARFLYLVLRVVAMNIESWLKRFVHHIWFIARFG